MTHTTGKWAYSEVPNDKGYWIVQAGKTDICIMQDNKSHMGKDTDPDPKTCKANARLISLAPDMLAAIKEYLRVKSKIKRDFTPEEKTDARQALKQLINQIEG